MKSFALATVPQLNTNIFGWWWAAFAARIRHILATPVVLFNALKFITRSGWMTASKRSGFVKSVTSSCGPPMEGGFSRIGPAFTILDHVCRSRAAEALL